MAGVGRAGVYIGVVAEGAGMRSLQPYFMSGEWAWVGKRVGAEGGKPAQMLGENRPIQRRPLCLLGGRNSWGHSRGEKTYALYIHGKPVKPVWGSSGLFIGRVLKSRNLAASLPLPLL